MNFTMVRRKNSCPIVTLVASLSISVVFTLAASVVLLIMNSSTEFVRPRDLGLLRLAYKYWDGPIVYLDRLAYKYWDGPIVYLDRALPALVSRHFYLPDPANILPLSAWAAIWKPPSCLASGDHSLPACLDTVSAFSSRPGKTKAGSILEADLSSSLFPGDTVARCDHLV